MELASLTSERILSGASLNPLLQGRISECERLLHSQNEQYDIPLRVCQPYTVSLRAGHVEAYEHYIEYVGVPATLRLGFTTSLPMHGFESMGFTYGDHVHRRVQVESVNEPTVLSTQQFQTIHLFNVYLCAEWFKVAEKNLPTTHRPYQQYLEPAAEPFRTYLFFVAVAPRRIDYEAMRNFINYRLGSLQGPCLVDKYLESKNKEQFKRHFQENIFYSSTHRTMYAVFAVINNIWQRPIHEFFDLIQSLSQNDLTHAHMQQYFDLSPADFESLRHEKLAYLLYNHKFRSRVTLIESLRDNMAKYEKSADYAAKKARTRQLNNCPLAIVEYTQSIRSLQYYETQHFSTMPFQFREYGVRKDHFRIKKPHVALMPIVQLHQFMWSAEQMTYTCHLPMIMLEVEKQVIGMELRHHLCIPQCSLLYLNNAIQSCSYNPHANYEVLETLGDSVLKFITTLGLYHAFPKQENYLTHKRTEFVNNQFLGTLAVDAQLHYFIRQTVLRYSDWITPILSRIELQKEAKMLAPHKQGFSLNQLADVYESILGAIFATEFRFDEVMSFLAATHNPLMAIAYNPAHLSGTFLVDPGCQLEYAFETSFLELAGTAPQLTEFDIRAIQSTKTKFQQQAKSYDHPRYSPYSKWLDYFQTEILGYTFKNIWLLVEALTQTGFESRAGLVPDYQRLEFLGDAVLECFIMGNIFRGFQGRTVTPHIMHKIKLQMLTNQSMGRMAMLKGFYAFLNPCTEIDEFAFACDFKLPLHRLQPYVRPPKMLSDVWESVSGALLLDGGWSAVSSTYGRYYRPFLQYLAQHVNNLELPPYERLMQYAETNKRKVQVTSQIVDDKHQVQVVFDGKVIGASTNQIESLAKEVAVGDSCNYLKI